MLWSAAAGALAMYFLDPQNGRRRREAYGLRGRRFELPRDWSAPERLAVGAFGLGLLMRRGIVGRLGGAALLAGAATHRGIVVQKAFRVQAPVEKVFAFWADYGNFPHFMSKVRDVRHAGNRSHWVVRGPAGIDVEWTSEVTAMEANSRIAWRSTADSQVKHEGQVRFEPDGEGTRVSVRMRYMPPAGVLGHAVASLLGADPKSEMDADLARMKTLIETGKPPHDAAQRV
jgi:uncharacterized membrane protein